MPPALPLRSRGTAFIISRLLGEAKMPKPAPHSIRAAANTTKLTGQAMAPEKRAFGMGVFFSAYFLLTAPAPGLAGWLFDRTHNPFMPLVFAIALFALTLGTYFAFRAAIAVKPSR